MTYEDEAPYAYTPLSTVMRYSKILKRQRATDFTMWNHYRAALWEFVQRVKQQGWFAISEFLKSLLYSRVVCYPA